LPVPPFAWFAVNFLRPKAPAPLRAADAAQKGDAVCLKTAGKPKAGWPPPESTRARDCFRFEFLFSLPVFALVNPGISR